MLKTSVGVAGLALAGSWAYLRHIMLPVGPQRTSWGQEVFGHRGSRFVQGIPENTVPAFEYAALNCASGIECDIRLCKSGELVAFHDPKLGPHVTNPPASGKDRIIDLTLNELRQLEFTEDTYRRGVQFATLDEIIAVARKHDVKLLIEMKPVPGASRAQVRHYIDKVLETFQKNDDFLYDRAMVISFNPVLLYRLRRRDPKIAVIQLSKPDIVSGVAAATGDSASLPLFARLMPSALADRVLHFLLYSVAPWVVGASAVGLPYTAYNDLEVHRWAHRKMFLYLWGFPNPESCVASMRSPNVAVCVDDEYGMYFLKPRYPIGSSQAQQAAEQTASRTPDNKS